MGTRAKVLSSAGEAKEAILRLVDAKTAPQLMSLEDAKEFIEGLIEDLEARLEGIGCDIKNMGGG